MDIIITPKAKKQLVRLSVNQRKKVQKRLLHLKKYPHSGKKLSGELEKQWVIRSWPYRIICYIDSRKKKIYITSILHRQSAYKK